MVKNDEKMIIDLDCNPSHLYYTSEGYTSWESTLNNHKFSLNWGKQPLKLDLTFQVLNQFSPMALPQFLF